MSSNQDTPYRAASFKAPEKPAMVWKLSWTEPGGGFPLMEVAGWLMALWGVLTCFAFVLCGWSPAVLRSFEVFGVFLTVWLALFLRRVPRA